jgi:hypothetical protein
MLSGSIEQRPPPVSGGRFQIVVLVAAGLTALAGQARGQAQVSTSQAAAGDVRAFQPGVRIDWARRAVHVDGQVVLREGLVEFLACFPGKEHESIVRLAAPATHVYMALGLVGLEPGRPPTWNEQRGRFGPPIGALIDVSVEWEEGGKRRTARGFEWLREWEYGRTPVDRPWVFTGSRRLSDGTLSADRGGDGIAVVDKPESLLALSRNHVSRDAELWAAANSQAIPARQTRVRLVLRPAEARVYDVRVDFRGAAFVDGRFVHPEDLADLIKLARTLSPRCVQTIRMERTLRSDAACLRKRLRLAGVSGDAFRFVWREAAEAGEVTGD